MHVTLLHIHIIGMLCNTKIHVDPQTVGMYDGTRMYVRMYVSRCERVARLTDHTYCESVERIAPKRNEKNHTTTKMKTPLVVGSRNNNRALEEGGPTTEEKYNKGHLTGIVVTDLSLCSYFYLFVFLKSLFVCFESIRIIIDSNQLNKNKPNEKSISSFSSSALFTSAPDTHSIPFVRQSSFRIKVNHKKHRNT